MDSKVESHTELKDMVAVTDGCIIGEKAEAPTVTTQFTHTDLTSEELHLLDSFSKGEKNRIFRKVDLRLIPILAILYLVSNIDRINIGNAKIQGIEKDLGMEGTDYNIALVVFFVSYISCEVPSNYLLAKFDKPAAYVGFLTVAFGVIMVLQGLVKNLGGLAATRFFLGVFEAGFFPGAVFIVSTWYPPDRTQLRAAMFFCAAALAGSFSGLLAGGIAHMDGLGGLEGWRWIFILEGIATIIAGVFAFFLLPSKPANAHWLNAEQKRFLELTQIATRGRPKTQKNRKQVWKVLKSVATDYKIYMFSYIMYSNSCAGVALFYMLPQIIKNMGFQSTTAQFLSAPPYLFAGFTALASSYVADRYSWRMPILIFAQLMVVISNSIQWAMAEHISDHVAVCYFASFLGIAGAYPIIPGINAWCINNLAGDMKRAIGIAYMLAVGSTGGIIGSFIFRNSEAPKYQTGFGVSLAVGVSGVFTSLALELAYHLENKKKERMTEEEIRAKYTDEELEEMGDKAPTFKYAL